jgi:hypothetical protein
VEVWLHLHSPSEGAAEGFERLAAAQIVNYSAACLRNDVGGVASLGKMLERTGQPRPIRLGPYAGLTLPTVPEIVYLLLYWNDEIKISDVGRP